MKIIIIGAVSGGTSAAVEARINDEEAEIIIFDKSKDISYSGCELPYNIGDKLKERTHLVLIDINSFKEKYNINIFPEHEVLNLDTEVKSLAIKNLKTKEIIIEHFDKLIIATGTKPLIPNILGVNNGNVFYSRKNDDRIKAFINKNNPNKAVIIGSGFLGLEMAENLKDLGIDVTLVELVTQVMSPLDKDITLYIQKYLDKKGINVVLGDEVVAIKGEFPDANVILRSGQEIETDFVIMAVGIKPNIEFAERAGIELGESGAINVNEKMQTNFDYIYACGDCSESYSLIAGKNIYRPFGSNAHKTGRIIGDSITGISIKPRGILGTRIFKIFDLTVAYTGLSEREAIQEGYAVVVYHSIKYDKVVTCYGVEDIIIKAVADKNTKKLLGVQIFSTKEVDKMIAVFATAITAGAMVKDFFHLNLAYDPIFSTLHCGEFKGSLSIDNINIEVS